MTVHFYVRKNWMYYDTIHAFSVWLRAGTYPPDINRFRNYTGNVLQLMQCLLIYLLALRYKESKIELTWCNTKCIFL